MKKNTRISTAEDTLESIEKGFYINQQGERILLYEAVQEAINQSIFFDEQPLSLPKSMPTSFNTAIELTTESTLTACKRLHEEGEKNIFVLNFASARNAGGGFLGGAQAQEESLARSSALYPCLTKFQKEYYEAHRSLSTCLYSDRMIYAPKVPVFKDDEGLLLANYYTVAFLTSPAVNAGVVRRQEPDNIAMMATVMRERLKKLLSVATLYQHEVLVLGAWGCGVFQNNPHDIAQYFYEALFGEDSPFRGVFRRVVFAIYAQHKKTENYEAFALRFGQ
ncbi:MAG: TIGR02452 family protein [Cytophagales bacterium]|nr:MAG: TIGR02452 family protein [Cytophagales bacterium]